MPKDDKRLPFDEAGDAERHRIPVLRAPRPPLAASLGAVDRENGTVLLAAHSDESGFLGIELLSPGEAERSDRPRVDLRHARDYAELVSTLRAAVARVAPAEIWDLDLAYNSRRFDVDVILKAAREAVAGVEGEQP